MLSGLVLDFILNSLLNILHILSEATWYLGCVDWFNIVYNCHSFKHFSCIHLFVPLHSHTEINGSVISKQKRHFFSIIVSFIVFSIKSKLSNMLEDLSPRVLYIGKSFFSLIIKTCSKCCVVSISNY